jgi:hypothetical protein
MTALSLLDLLALALYAGSFAAFMWPPVVFWMGRAA